MTTDKLQALYDNEHLEINTHYSIMPSDCRGDGYDIALRNRPDESGTYQLRDGIVAIVKCAVKVGSKRWADGIPAVYDLQYRRPSDCVTVQAEDLSANVRRQLNILARQHGYGSCTTLVRDRAAREVSIEHEPYGVEGKNGRFWPGMTYNYPGETYRRATTVIIVPSDYYLA